MTPYQKPERKDITTSGEYALRLSLPKIDWVKSYTDEDGKTNVTATLFFSDVDGNSLKKKFGTKYPKPLAMLVGKFTGQFTKEIIADATPEEFLAYLQPAIGPTCMIAVEVEQDPNRPTWTDKEGVERKNWKYKLIFPRGTVRPTLPAKSDKSLENPPF